MFILEWGPRVRRTALLVGVAGVPLFCLPSIVADIFPTPKLALLGALVLCVAGIRLSEAIVGRSGEGLRAVTVPVVAVVLPLLIAWIASPYKAWGIYGIHQRYEGLLPTILLAMFALLLADAFRNDVGRVVTTLLGAAALVGGYTVVQFVGLDPVSWPAQADFAFSTIGNSNFVGGFLAIAAALAPVKLSVRGRRRAAWLGVTFLIWAGLAAAHGEGGLVAAAGGTVLTVGLLAGRSRPRIRAAGAVGALLIAIALPGTVVLARVNPSAGELVGNQGVVRADFWEATAGVAAAHPLTGAGPDGFALEGISHRPARNARQYGSRFTSAPHSVPLAYFANAGILGLGGFLVVMFWAARTTLRETRLGSAAEPLALASAGGTAAYFIQSLVSIDDISIRTAFWVALACLAAAVTRVHSDDHQVFQPSTRARIALATAVGVAGILGGAWWGGRLLLADRHVLVATELFAAGDTDEAWERFENALALRDAPIYRRFYGERLGVHARELGPEGAPYIERMRAQYAYLEDAPDLGDIMGYARSLYNWAPNQQSAYNEALALYEQALEIDPKNPVIAVQASDVLIELGRTTAAVDLLESYELPSQFPLYWGALARAYAADGRTEEAELALERALAVDPDDQRAAAARDLLEAD